MSRLADNLRSRIVAGFLVLLPAAVTVWLLVVIFRAADHILTDQALWLLGGSGAPSALVVWIVRAGAVVAVLALLYVAGFLATNVVGRRLLAAAERGMTQIPGLGRVYRGARQLLDAVGQDKGGVFRRCVLVEFPRRGLHRLAFVTSERRQQVGDPPRECLAVFIPSTPNPASGFLAFIPAEECVALTISTEEALKMIVSGGIVSPAALGVLGGAAPPAQPGSLPP